MTAPFFERLAQIDKIISAGPCGLDLAKALLPLFQEEASKDYFFDKLLDASWLEPLVQAGLFQNPPPPRRDSEGNIMYRAWSESRYLPRVAGQAPRGVLDIILHIPETDNIRVHEDCIDAALEMPPDIAVSIVAKALKWLESPCYLLLPDKVGALSAYLAKGGEAVAALKLARSLLAILPAPGTVGISAPETTNTRSFGPRFDTWRYGRILQEYIPPVVQTAGVPALEMLCDLLEDALRLSRMERDKPADDYSYIWRTAIEDDSEGYRDELKNSLVSAVRDAAQQIASAAGAASVEELVGILEKRPWPVFQRIALHLLRVCSHSELGMVAERLTDRKHFDDVAIRHEYMLLLKAWFARLSEVEQSEILGWIEDGPRYLRPDDPPGVADNWRRNWLSIISDNLPPEWRQRYDRLVADLGPAEHPEFPVHYTATWVGPTSPRAAAELASMSIEEIVRYLQAWEPPKGAMEHSPEGLGRALGEAAASDPARYAKAALQFCVLSEPTYINALFHGFRKGLEGKRTFPWQPVIELAHWAVAQPREISGRGEDGWDDLDPHWGWTRQSIARLLEYGFRAERGRIPSRLRRRAWQLLEVLAEDPDPIPEHEAKYGGSNQDPATMSINTVRGVAMHAVIHYAFWVRRHLEKRENGKDLVARGLEEMPEVRTVLNRHLDPAYDPSLAIRSVYGRWFPQLVLLDPAWAGANVSTIFPPSQDLSDLRDAAWEAYMAFGKLYGSVYDILHEEYERAVERIGAASPDKRRLANPDEDLGKHLMVVYWWGRIGLQELDRFFSLAPPKLRGDALAYIGQSLREMPDKIGRRTLARLKELWEWRLAEVRSLPPSDRRAELSSFGWWFTSEKFSETWSLKQLQEALKYANWAEPDDDVVEQLAKLAPQKPMVAVECLAMMTEGDQQGWATGYSWVPSIRTIVSAALHSSDVRARRAARELVNRLGAKGFLQFRDLLTEQSGD